MRKRKKCGAILTGDHRHGGEAAAFFAFLMLPAGFQAVIVQGGQGRDAADGAAQVAAPEAQPGGGVQGCVCRDGETHESVDDGGKQKNTQDIEKNPKGKFSFFQCEAPPVFFSPI